MSELFSNGLHHGAVQGAVVWVFICLALALADDFRRRRADLVEQAVRLEAARIHDSGALVALREVKGAEEIDADGEVSVTAHDLSGTRQAIELRKVEAGGYTDLIGTARVSPRNSYRFEVVVTAGPEGVRFLLVSGAPLQEPVAWHGPIVMNTKAELETAMRELRNGTFIKPAH